MFKGVGWSEGLADLLRWTRPPLGADAFPDGAITFLNWTDVEKVLVGKSDFELWIWSE